MTWCSWSHLKWLRDFFAKGYEQPSISGVCVWVDKRIRLHLEYKVGRASLREQCSWWAYTDRADFISEFQICLYLKEHGLEDISSGFDMHHPSHELSGRANYLVSPSTTRGQLFFYPPWCNLSNHLI